MTDKNIVSVKASFDRSEIIVSFAYSPERLNLVREKLNPEMVKENDRFKYWRLPISQISEERIEALIGDERFFIEESVLSIFEVTREWRAENYRLASQLEAEPLTVRGIELTRYQSAGVAVASRNPSGFIVNDPENMDRVKIALSSLHLVGCSNILIVTNVISRPPWVGFLKSNYLSKNDSIMSHASVKPYTGPIHNYHVIAYNLIPLQLDFLTSVEWQGLIFDSCEFLKNEKSEASKAAAAIVEASRLKMFLSGFDLSQDPAGLLNILRLAGRLNEFGGFWKFANKYCEAKKTAHGWDFSGKSNLDELKKELMEICYIRRA